MIHGAAMSLTANCLNDWFMNDMIRPSTEAEMEDAKISLPGKPLLTFCECK